MANQLGEVEKLLITKYPNLFISQNVSINQDKKETVFLHLRKARPMLRGLSFLPTFHVMVLPSENDPFSREYTVQLMTYTGKVVMEDQIMLEPSGQDFMLKADNGGPSGYEIIQNFCDDKYYLCPGIDQVNKKRVIKSLARIKAYHLDKVRNFFLMESFNNETSLRTKRCQFAVTEEEVQERRQREEEEDGEEADKNTDDDEELEKRCIECEKFQFRIQRIRRELDGDEALTKEVETLIAEGQFRVMKDDNRILHWNDTNVFSGKKIEPVAVKRERGQEEGSSENGDGKKGKKGSGKGPGGNTVKKEKTDEPEFAMTCTICLHTYPSLNSYEIDQRRHQKAFDLRQLVACPLCIGMEPMEKKDLTVHFHDHHPDRGTCCCECLEIMSPEDDNLRRHMLKLHSDSLKSTCPFCNTTFTEKYRLKVHIQQVHEKSNSAICDHCGKLFGHRSLMVKHRRLAHGEKNFLCTICEKGFTSLLSLNMHLHTHTGLKPYKCIVCDYRSCRLTNVWMHVRKMHNRKGTHEDVEVFEDELKQMQAMELDNVPYKAPEFGEGLEEMDEVYGQEDNSQNAQMQDEDMNQIHVIQDLDEQ